MCVLGRTPAKGPQIVELSHIGLGVLNRLSFTPTLHILHVLQGCTGGGRKQGGRNRDRDRQIDRHRCFL